MTMRPVSINGIEFDAQIESEYKMEAEVPEYATEQGYTISDSIIRKPRTLDLTLFLTNTPVTWASRFGTSNNRVYDVTGRLESLYFSRVLCTVITSDQTFNNMAITSLSITKSAELGYSREVKISLKEVIVTESKTATVPDMYGKSGVTGADAGAANTSGSSNASTNISATAAWADSIYGSKVDLYTLLYGEVK